MSIPNAEALVHGRTSPIVIVSARVAAYLNRHADLARFRISHRGEDPEVDATLQALAAVGAAWRGSATGTRDALRPELDPSSSWLSTTQAAGRLGITDSGIRKAIREHRLSAQQIGGRYRIAAEDLEHFRAARAA